MKYLFLLAFLIGSIMSVLANPINNQAEDIALSDLEDEQYVIVYRFNGKVHVCFVNHYVDCNKLAQNPAPGVTILDCGPVNSVQVPEDAEEITESGALSHFGYAEWPQ